MEDITYRPFAISDLPSRMKWLNDPAVNQYLRTRVSNDLVFYQKWMNGYFADETQEIFMIMADKKPIGQVGLLNINLHDKSASLYITIGESDYRGKGIGKQATKYILNHAFNNLDLHRIWLDTNAENIPGIKCYIACGFIKDDNYKDQVLYPNGHCSHFIGMYIINPKHLKNKE